MRHWPFVLGGLLLGTAVTSAISVASVGPRVKQVQQGWSLRPVVVVAVDVAEGSVLTAEMITQASFPEQFVTPSMVSPDEVGPLLGRRLTLPLLAGDALVASSLDARQDAEAFKACVKAVTRPAEERSASVMASATEQVVASARTEPAPPAPLEVPLDGMVVVVTRDLEEGATLEASDLGTGTLPAMLRTPSLVPASEKPLLPGARLLIPLAKGDALRWQMLDDAETPSTPVGCELVVGAQVAKARTAAAHEAAKQWAARRHPEPEVPR